MRFMRIRVNEIFKFVVAVAIGFTLRIMMETGGGGMGILPSLNMQHAYQPAGHKNGASKAARAAGASSSDADYDEQLREQYVPRLPDDVIEYRYFTSEHVYDIHRAVPRSAMKKYQRVDIKDIVKAARNFIKSNGHQDYVVHELRNGYERIDPLRGKEYLLDMEVSVSRDAKAPRQHMRLSLVKPFDKERLVAQSKLESAPNSGTVHVLLAVTLAQANATLHWVEDFAKNVYRQDKRVVLLLLLFHNPAQEKAAVALERQLRLLKIKYQLSHVGAPFKVVRSQHRFSPHFGKNLGAHTLPQSAAMVFADLSVRFRSDFFVRCRATLQHRETAAAMADHLSSASRAVYVPIPFSLFAMRPSSAVDITAEQGYWNHDSHQVFCLTKATYTNAGVFDVETKNSYSLDENRALYARLVANKIPILRSGDPAVLVNYSMLTCADMVKARYMNSSRCTDLQLRSRGSCVMLAQKLDVRSRAAGAT